MPSGEAAQDQSRIVAMEQKMAEMAAQMTVITNPLTQKPSTDPNTPAPAQRPHPPITFQEPSPTATTPSHCHCGRDHPGWNWPAPNAFTASLTIAAHARRS